jgi:hypothetical protein
MKIKITEKEIVGTIPKCNRSFFWLGAGTSIKSNVVKLVLWAETSFLSDWMQQCCCKESWTLYIKYLTEVVICIILFYKWEQMASTIIYILFLDTRSLKGIMGKQWSTLKCNLIANTIFGHLYAGDRILFIRTQDFEVIFMLCCYCPSVDRKVSVR